MVNSDIKQLTDILHDKKCRLCLYATEKV